MSEQRDNIGTWDENKKTILENCKDTKEIKLMVNAIQIDMASFKGKIWGVVAAVSAGVSILITIFGLIIGQSGIFK